MQDKIIIGIDPSIRATGVSFTGPDIEHSDTISVKATQKGFRGERHAKIYERIEVLYHALVGENNPATVIFVFEHFVMTGPGRIGDLAELAGYLKGRIESQLKPDFILEVPPSLLKLFIARYGNASKQDMIMHVKRRYGRGFEDDNQCDAFALTRFADYLWDSSVPEAKRKDWREKTKFF